MKLTLSSFQNRRGNRLGIIPPNIQRNTIEEGTALDHPGQDRLGPFARQRHGKTKARVTPRQDQHRDLPTTVWNPMQEDTFMVSYNVRTSKASRIEMAPYLTTGLGLALRNL